MHHDVEGDYDGGDETDGDECCCSADAPSAFMLEWIGHVDREEQ